MSCKKRLKLYLAAISLLIMVLIGYKVYLILHETDYQGLNADHIGQIEDRLHGKNTFSFAVVGNIRNSMRIFEKRIAPMIRDGGADFMISDGNAVYDGAEDKYRLLYRGLRNLDIPYVLGAGLNELEDFGAGRFYRHFGPYFFSFPLNDAYFIFLDTTGQTSWKWQMRWLRQELASAGKYRWRFVVMNRSPFPLPGFDPDNAEYALDGQLGRRLQNLFSKHRVTAVFSGGYPVYHETMVKGVRYVVSGGAGGLLLGQENYQVVMVNVGPEGVTCENMSTSHGLGTFPEKLETLKLFLHSFFYMSFFNSLMILSGLGLVALKVYSLIIRQEHLYRDFNVDEESLSKTPLRVGMFTNAYLPFIGGVPLSIERLYRGLARLGAVVKVFAPAYPKHWDETRDEGVFRCPAVYYTRVNAFPVTNIFSRSIDEAFRNFGCDLVHVHHPYWLGKKGLRLARKKGVPVVFTFHTRLDQYTHYIPFPGTFLKNFVAHAITRQFANRCDAIITPTASTEEYLRNLGVSALIETIPTGIDTAAYRNWSGQQIRELRCRYADPDECLLISVSRMAKEKNLDFLIDGLAKAASRTCRPFKCLLVGEGPERERLREKTAGLGLDGRVIFTGNLAPHDVIRCYLAADLFVFASTSETQGMVLLEAMAGGCPVVAVRASGVHDVVKDGYNGFKVAESTYSWAEKVADLLDDGERLSALSENSRAFAENYSIEKITEKVIRLYQRVIVLYRSGNE